MQTRLIEDGRTSAGAVFSQDRKYRYRLWRIWDESKPVCAFIMLNPSTADEFVLDPTVRKCVAYAKKWGYGALEVGNIFALKSTSPALLYSEPDPVGPLNDANLMDISHSASLVVAAWGVHGEYRNRGAQVRTMIPDMHCLSLTKGGQPGHPLYLKGDVEPFSLKPIIRVEYTQQEVQ